MSKKYCKICLKDINEIETFCSLSCKEQHDILLEEKIKQINTLRTEYIRVKAENLKLKAKNKELEDKLITIEDGHTITETNEIEKVLQ